MFKSSTRIARIARMALGALALALMGAAHAGAETVALTGAATAPLRGLFPNEGEAIVGAYRMADGREMVLKQRGRFILADLDGVPTTRLMAGEAGTLQSADDSMRLRFDKDPQNEATAVTMSLRVEGANTVTLAAAKTTGR